VLTDRTGQRRGALRSRDVAGAGASHAGAAQGERRSSWARVPFEATTPTGAALLAAFVDEFVARPTLRVQRVGYGIGHRDSPIPNVLRVLLGEASDEEGEQNELCVLECNIDDMNPECYDHVLERLFAAAPTMSGWCRC
jgi:uncharacterized protein (DUF111 family)